MPTTTTTVSTDFAVFGRAVNARFREMSKHELYTTELAGDLFDVYLAAYPERTNPVYRVRTVADCVCCKSFVRRLGGLVTIKDGHVGTVWEGLDLPYPYNVVAEKLDWEVRNAAITGVFRTKERRYGQEYNYDAKTNERHDHFWGDVADRHHAADPGAKIGERAAAFQVLQRGLAEIHEADLETVIDLIESNGLYRGEEHKAAVVGFLGLLRAYNRSGLGSVFAWENIDNRNARFRNTVIGELLVNLAEGMGLDKAVRKYEAMVAPANYKRPTAVITQRMVDDALATINKLDLGGAISRRYARLSDVSVNDVLFVDNNARPQMKDGHGIADLLASAVKPAAPDLSRAVKIGADEFVKTVLPGAKTLDCFVENRHAGNFVSLTGADGPERLFKWDNNFAWSYDGDLADSDLRRRVQELGGRVDGVLRFSHKWNYGRRNASLMDLHVFMPGSTEHKDGCHDNYPAGQRVGWNRRNDPTSGGVQDVDYTNAAPAGYVPVENITFPTKEKLRDGVYTFKCHNWMLRSPTDAGFAAEIEFGGQVYQYEVTRPLKNKEWVTVATATLKTGVFTINHVLPSSTTSQDKWGVKTETLCPVVLAAYSPNHWSGNAVGAKHLILALRDCRNPGSCRTIYNEFLRADLTTHGKVFEALAGKTKAPYSAEQVSGLGFTAARGDTVTVVVDGRRAYTLTF